MTGRICKSCRYKNGNGFCIRPEDINRNIMRNVSRVPENTDCECMDWQPRYEDLPPIKPDVILQDGNPAALYQKGDKIWYNPILGEHLRGIEKRLLALEGETCDFKKTNGGISFCENPYLQAEIDFIKHVQTRQDKRLDALEMKLDTQNI